MGNFRDPEAAAIRKRLLTALVGSLCASLFAACQINDIERPINPCTAPLRKAGTGHPVAFANPSEGQLSLYRRFRLSGDTLGFTGDTLLAMVGTPYPDAFAYIEQECPENYLAPERPFPSSHVLQWVDGKVRPSGFTLLLPYDPFQGLDLHPQGPIFDFRGLRPPEGLDDSLYGRILGFTLGSRVFDTVSVRIEREDWALRFWIYTAEDGPLAAGQAQKDGQVYGWIRTEGE